MAAFVVYLFIKYLSSRSSITEDIARIPAQPLPANIKTQFCLPWTPASRSFPFSDLYRARTSFTLPASTSEFFLLREGYVVPATIHIDQSGDVESKDVKVDVVMDTEDKSLFNEIEICAVKKSEKGDGFSIAGRYDPRRYQQHIKRTSVDITIRLPKVAKGKLEIANFNIMNLYVCDIQIGDLGEGVLFGKLKASTTVGSIRAKSVQAISSINMNVEKGEIYGTFASRDAITLGVTVGEISATVLLTSERDKQATLDLDVETGAITSKISLFHDKISPFSPGGNFSIGANVKIGGVSLTTPYIVPSSFISLSSFVSVGIIELDMHPSYEGTFSLGSGKLSHPTVQFDNKREDPEGNKRKRFLTLKDQAKNHVSGEVLWLDSQVPGRNAGEKGKINLGAWIGNSVLKL